MRPGRSGQDESPIALPARQCELVIFDLDGVLTRTARVHAAAWKQTFDAFLARCAGGPYRPFDAHADYLAHVDGKPRLDGVRDFLASRGIVLPEGGDADDGNADTVKGLGNTKNKAFVEVLARDGVQTYPGAVGLLRRLQACGIRRAVVSASRNCRRILDEAGLADDVDTVVDGNDADREGLAGKPAPDTFLAAASRLQVPAARAAVIEDAESGVAAARAGGFGWVIGVDRDGHAEALAQHGAHHVVDNLDRVQPEPLPSALADFASVAGRLAGAAPVLFLDYDGTLTPIVARPQDAVLAPPMRQTLTSLARLCTVVVVTGRGLDVIRDLMDVQGVVYAADHGFQVDFGEGARQPPVTAGFEDLIAGVTAELQQVVGEVPGVLVEPKRYSVAVHYRLVAQPEVDMVKARVQRILQAQPRLRLLPGKKVLELQPDVAWDKGAAVGWVMEALTVEPHQAVYVGDDVTDEAAFRLLRQGGVTVAVQDTPRPTAAAWRLTGVDQVQEFLERIGSLGSGDPC